MKADNQNNNQYDAFNEAFRQKLKELPLSLDDSIWTEIEAKLQHSKKRVIPFWFWLSGGAAVAGIALLFFFLPLSNHQNTFTNTSTSRPEKSFSKPNLVHFNTYSAIANAMPLTKGIAATASRISISKKKSFGTNSSSTFQTVVNQPKIDSVESLAKISVATIENNKQKIENQLSNSSDTTSNTKLQMETSLPDLAIVNNHENQPDKKRKANGIRLSAAVGAADGASDFSTNSLFNSSLNFVQIVSTSANLSYLMTPADFTTVHYDVPLSFGISVQLPLKNNWEIESGLTYTYLTTYFENGKMQRNDAVLHLHYIGIPINLVKLILKNNRWDLYISGGGMIEKGIRSNYIQHQYFGNQMYTTTVLSNITGIQESINAATGVNYKLQKHWSLYFEPKIAYFFNNNQPISIRTKQPVTIGLTAGLRFELNP